MKKFLTMLLVLLVCLQVFSVGVTFGAVVYSDNLAITSHKVSISDIYEKYEFKLNLYCRNTFSEEIKDVYIEINPDCAFISSASNTIKVYDSIQNKGAIYESFPINLIYKGKGDDFSFSFKYKVGNNDYIEMKNITIGNVHENYDSAQQEVVTKLQYVPNLNITGGIGVTDASAGSTLNVTYPIKNNSNYSAKNVSVTIEMEDKTKAPYVLGNIDLKQTVDLINGNETKNVSFKLDILKTAPEGMYGMKLNYQFQNSFNDSFSTSETVYIKVQNEKPWLTVDSIALAPDTTSNSGNANLKINFTNLGNMPAKEIKVTLKGLKSGGFTTCNTTDVKYITGIDGKATGSVTYLLSIPGSGAAASNDLTVKFDYRDEMGNTYTDENQIFLPTGEAGDGRPALVFDNIQYPQGTVEPNQNFKIGFSLKNTGEGSARNISVSLTSDKEVVTRSLSNIIFSSIDGNNSKNVEFTLFATGDAVTRNYPVALNLQYEDAFGVKYTATQYVGVFVENGAGKSVPRIIVDKYSFEPAEVKAGEDFKLKLSFLNTSSTAVVSNIKVSLTSDDGVLTPSNSSNTFFIEAIGTKESVEKELILHVKPDADAKSYILSANFDYEDEKGTPITSKETVSVPVTQNPRLVTGELSLPPETFTGQPMQVCIDFYNMGKSILYNLMVTAEGDFQGQNLSYYVGNFESGRSDSFDTSIIPNTAGALKGSIVFSFEDANGKKNEVRKEFNVNVTEMKQETAMPQGGANGIMIGPDGKPVAQAAGGFHFSFLVVGVIALVVIAAVVTFIILRKKHIKRKEMSLDE